MAKIKWTNLAMEDLESIYEYIAKDSQDDKIGIARIHHAAGLLKRL